MPILDTIVETYKQLENVRICVHQNMDRSMFLVRQPSYHQSLLAFQKRNPKPVNYKETIAVFLKEYYLVGDWLSHCFPDFAAFPVDQKDILHRSFYLQFVVLEGGFFSCNHSKFYLKCCINRKVFQKEATSDFCLPETLSTVSILKRIIVTRKDYSR